MDYGFAHEGKIYTPDQSSVDAADNEARNRALDLAELQAWSKCPEQWHCYVTGGSRDVTTWLGSKIGTITSRTTFSTNLSRRVTAITVRGTNGATYHGRFGADWSQLCRLTKSKKQA